MPRMCLKGVRHRRTFRRPSRSQRTHGQGVRHRRQRAAAHRKREASSPDAIHRVSARRPPARPTGRGPRKPLQTRASAAKNLKNSTRPSARQAETTRARRGVGLGRAGRVDAPEGIGRQSPKATTTMTKGKSGAKAPDRNRSPARPRPTPCPAPQEPSTLAPRSPHQHLQRPFRSPLNRFALRKPDLCVTRPRRPGKPRDR